MNADIEKSESNAKAQRAEARHDRLEYVKIAG
jgi:hypothetical protein